VWSKICQSRYWGHGLGACACLTGSLLPEWWITTMARHGDSVQGPSRTAVLTAVARAVHREEPQPWVIDDYLALHLAGQEGLALLERLRAELPLLLAFGRWV
jgi:hypothetical protein